MVPTAPAFALQPCHVTVTSPAYTSSTGNTFSGTPRAVLTMPLASSAFTRRQVASRYRERRFRVAQPVGQD